jgi:hypothetical protein
VDQGELRGPSLSSTIKLGARQEKEPGDTGLNKSVASVTGCVEADAVYYDSPTWTKIANASSALYSLRLTGIHHRLSEVLARAHWRCRLSLDLLLSSAGLETRPDVSQSWAISYDAPTQAAFESLAA